MKRCFLAKIHIQSSWRQQKYKFNKSQCKCNELNLNVKLIKNVEIAKSQLRKILPRFNKNINMMHDYFQSRRSKFPRLNLDRTFRFIHAKFLSQICEIF